MSLSEDVIAKFPPTGVEHLPIDEVITNLRTGLNPRSNFKLNTPGARNLYMTVRELGGFDLRPSEKTDYVDDEGLARIQNRSRLRKDDVLFSGTGTIGRTALVSDEPHDWNIKEGVYALTPRSDRILSRFLIYALHSRPVRDQVISQADGSTVVSIPMATFRKVMIPVPPLEVQQKIVQILDKFFELQENLEMELKAELEARRIQYEHYRSILTTATNGESQTLDEIFDMRSGKFIAASSISNIQSETHMYPCYGGNGLRGYVSKYNRDGDLVLIGRQGALSGNTKRVSGKFYATEHAVVVTPRDASTDIDWAFFKLTSMNLNQYVSKGAQPGLAVGTLKTLEVQVPSVADQSRVARTLWSLDALISELSIGIPAELTARRKQYEYYRDRLLMFEKAAA